MVFKSKIKWVALFVLVLSFASLLRHLSIAKYSTTVDLVQYSALTAFHNDFDSILGRQVAGIHFISILFGGIVWWIRLFDGLFLFSLLQRIPNKKLWAAVKPLQSLQPYANPRSNNPGDDHFILYLILHLCSSYLHTYSCME